MATKNYEPLEVKTERFNCADVYRGTAEALVGAKIVAQCDLPGEPGNNRFSVVLGARKQAGYTKIERRPRTRTPDLFVVRIWVSAEEELLRKKADETERRENNQAGRINPSHRSDPSEFQRAVWASMRRVNKSLTAADFLDCLGISIKLAASRIKGHTVGVTPQDERIHQYCLDNESGREAVRLLNLACKTLAGATVTHDKSQHSTAALEVLEKARDDRGFQRFLEVQGMR